MNTLKITVKVISLFLGCFFSTILLQAQEPGTGDETGFQRTSALDKSLVLPNSPEASSLGKFGEFNVSAYTGSASLQVPILTLSGKTTSIPINLVYDGSAIKLDNREGWTGVSWNLTTNFAVTRNVVATPDLAVNYYDRKDELAAITNTDLFVENELLYDISTNEIESQPDNFYVSGPFGTSKFYISPEKEVVQKEHQNLKITPFFESDGDISRFTVRDDKGVLYEYAATEETDLYIDDQFGGDIAPYFLNHRFNSAWHLTKITGTNGIEKFLFSYETASSQYALDINPFYYQSVTYNPQNMSTPNCCGNANESSFSGGSTNTSYIIGRKHLMNIKYVLGTDTLERVLFESSANSCPYANSTDKRLDRIRCLKGANGEVNIKDYELKYYDNNGGCSDINRLLLKSVQEKSPDGSEFKEPYLFEYNTSTALDNYISSRIDHFGYFNNNSANTLIPKITPQGGTVLNSTGANRNPSLSRTKVGILEKVVYPMGGYSTYTWEMHKAAGLGAGNYYDYDPTQDAAVDREVGGLRIAVIEHFDYDNALLTKRSWKYEKSGTHPTNKSSSGLMLNELDYTGNPAYDFCPVPIFGGGGSCNTNYTCNRTTISAAPRSNLGTVKGSHIGYARVEEIIEANDGSGETSGKTVYFFKNERLSQFGLKDDVENGLLTQKEVYDADGKLLDKSVFTYSTDEGETRKRDAFFGFRVVPKEVQDNKIFLCKNVLGNFFWTEESGNATCNEQRVFRTKFERRYTEHLQRWVYQSEMTNTSYFYNGNTLTGQVSTTIDYIYGDTTTNQATETLVTNSDGKVYRTTTHFVNSFDDTEYPVSDDSGLFVRAMQLKGMTSFPLVQTQYIDGQLVYKTKLNYRNQSGLVLPYKLYEQFSTTGDRLAEVFDNYDGVGNLRQGHRHYEHSSGASQGVTMIYTDGNSRMAAQVKNADIGEVAYTGFESNESYQGGWLVPHVDTEIQYNNFVMAGKGHYQSFNPSFTAETIRTIVNAGTYIVSYYTNQPSSATLDETGLTVLSKKVSDSGEHPHGWRYVEYKIRLDSRQSVKLNVNYFISIDELRLYPADALMSTFSYDKDNRLVVGIQDENSLTSYFEYDKLLRLTGVKNFDKHYVSLNEYLYKNNSNANNTIKSWSLLSRGQTNSSTAKNLGSGDVVKVNSYFDGIGRSLMSASVGTSAAGRDQIQLQRYDKFGRQAKQYLPFTLAENNGAYINKATALSNQQAFISTEYGGANAGFGLVQTELESSPLNRVFKQRAAGSSFYSHPTQTEYGANGASQVRNFQAIGGWYAADELFKVIQRDENGNNVLTYTDRIGRKVMQDQQGSKTYFLYDTLGLLAQVIQPVAAQKGHDTPMLTYTDGQIEDGSFLYTYDSEYRMKTKVVPGCAAYTYFYDDLDQLVMTQDGNGFKTFTKYDKLGRPVLTGRYKGGGTPTTSQVVFEEHNSTAPHYYSTNQSFPSDGNIDIYTVNYYDDYDINGDDTEEVNYELNSITNPNYTNYSYVRGMPTASKVAILNNDGSAPSTYLNAYTFYDQFRRVIHGRKENHLNGEDKVWTNYNFAGWVKQTSREHTTNISGQITSKTTNERWEHDHIGRELQYYHEVVGDQAEKLISEKVYNERDEVVTKKLGNTTGSNFLQTIDYAYNIRKWLTAINNPNSLSGDLFGMNLVYEAATSANYNGNITSISWRNSSDGSKKTYDYSYDNLNRLTAATYKQPDPVATSFSSRDDRFNSTYNYDQNGNITTLTRNGFSGSAYEQIDNLGYTYADDGALSSITESSNTASGFKSKIANGTGGYTYDDNGNMITDIHKGMSVTYNYLNLPVKVTKPEGIIEWVYDAVGTKLSKTVTTNQLTVNDNPMLSKEYKAQMIDSKGTVDATGSVTFTAGQEVTLKAGFTASAGSAFLARIMPNTAMQVRDYCGGIEYIDANLEAIYFADGRVKYDGNISEREYVLSDYQGNNRVLFKDVGGTAEVVEDYSGYYPFGAIHSQKSDYESKYLFGGKELQTELDLGWSDFGTRCFDNWSGKWLGIDIMSEVTPQASPYGYTLGNPIRYSDPTGMLTEDENGLITTSTSLSGRDATGGENTGQILNSNFLSEGQLTRDVTTISTDGSGGNSQNNDWLPLTRDVIRNVVGSDYWNELESQGLTGVRLGSKFWADAGRELEDAVLSSIDDLHRNEEKFGGSVPDGVSYILNGKWWKGFLNKAHFTEIKVTEIVPPRGRNVGQLSRMISYLGNHRIQDSGLRPILSIITPSGTRISDQFIREASQANVVLYHATIEYNRQNPNVIRTTPFRHINSIQPTHTVSFLNRHGSPTSFF